MKSSRRFLIRLKPSPHRPLPDFYLGFLCNYRVNSLAAVTSDSVQFLAAGSTATISVGLGGVDIVMLSVQSNKLDYSVFATPEVKTPQDLKGRVVTGTRPGASAARRVLGT